jgi:hypothetical protein
VGDRREKIRHDCGVIVVLEEAIYKPGCLSFTPIRKAAPFLSVAPQYTAEGGEGKE